MTSYAKLVFVIVFQTLLGIRVFSHFIILLERAKCDTNLSDIRRRMHIF